MKYSLFWHTPGGCRLALLLPHDNLAGLKAGLRLHCSWGGSKACLLLLLLLFASAGEKSGEL
eukprot:2204814-Prorocentrum_lima.AAC.1